METKVENKAIEYIKKPGNMLYYKVEVNYFSDKAPISYFPSFLRIDWYELEKKEGKLVKKKDQKFIGGETINNEKPKAAGATSVSLDSGSASQLMAIANLPHDLAAFIVAARGGGFITERRFINSMTEYYKVNRPNVDFETKYWKPFLKPKLDEKILTLG